MTQPHMLIGTIWWCVIWLAATGAQAGRYREPTMLQKRVETGTLPPVDERLPRDPIVVDTGGSIGRYGGQMRVMSSSVTDLPEVDFMVAEPILRFQADGKTIAPNIVRAWEMSDDGKSITLYLRDGMRWSDGAPLTSEDFRFAYEDAICNEKITPGVPGKYTTGGTPMQIELIDDTTFRYVFSESYGAFPYFLTQSTGAGIIPPLVLPKHYLQQFHPKYTLEAKVVAEAKERGFDHWNERFIEDFTRRVAGPMTQPNYPVLCAWHVSSVPAEGQVILERNPYYWKVDREGNQLPYIDAIRSTCVLNPEAQNLKLISGDLDLGALEGTFDNAPLFMNHRQQGNYRVYFYECNWGSRVAYYLNQTHRDPVLREIFQNRKFRIALSLGINRSEINQVLHFGKCQPKQLTVNPVCSYYRSEFGQSYAEYDPEKANQLLDEIGLHQRRGGWRIRPDGKILTISCEVLDGGFRPQTTELIKEYWEDLGILVAFRVVDHNLWRTRWQGNLLDIMIFPDDVATDVSVLNVMVYGIQNWAPQWWRYFSSNGEKGEKPPPEIRQLYDIWREMVRTTDEAHRTRLGTELIRSQAENLWGLGTIARMVRPIIVSHRLHNVPEQGLWGYPWRATSLHHPEQFYLAQNNDSAN